MEFTSPDKEQPIKLVHCTWATGLGAGAGRMESYYYRFHNRSRFSVSAISLRVPDQNFREYQSPVPIQYVGGKNRFELLFEIFRFADIVQFQGSFDPLVCEAARLAEVPILVEVLHNVELGGLFPAIDATVCVSNTVALAQKGAPRAVTILNGIDLSDFPYVRTTSPDKIVLLQVSNREKPWFNLDAIASELLGLDPRIELWLAGHHQNLPSDERVKFLGVREDIASLYQSADFMVLFSKIEPFGLAAIEAMACGCLPIVSNDGGFSEIVTHGTDGWLADPHDRNLVIETIRTAISSNKLDEMRKAARTSVEQRFQAEPCVRKYEELYEQLLQTKGRRRSPGPEFAEPTAEALLGEAMCHSQQHHWKEVDDVLLRVVEAKSAFTIPTSAETAKLFARSAYTRGHYDLAMRLYGKIYQSGFNSAHLLKLWLEDFKDTGDWSLISRACLEFSSTQAEANLLLVEQMINAKETAPALRHLAEAEQRSKRSPELSTMYKEWHDRIAELLNIGR